MASKRNNVWDELAKKNAEFYIATSDVDFSTPQGKAAFFELGRGDAARILAESATWRLERRRALEIGCGIGRVTLAMAEHFDEIVAVDISPTMLEGLRQNCAERGVDHVVPMLTDEPWHERGPVDFAWSYIVFQHIESWSIIENVLSRIARALSPDGVAHLHFDTRPATPVYRLRNLLPDVLLPDTQRRGIRRIRRSGAEVLNALARVRLQVVARLHPESSRDTLIVTRIAT